jgi:NitT/TauT family transport system permease protein
MCFPIAYTNILSGIMGRDRKLDELGTVLGLTGKQKWSMILRPELQPEIRASVNLITGMSWKVVVASEVLAIPKHSIGYEMLNSKYYLETPDLFAYIIVLILLSISLEKAASYIAEADQKRARRRVKAEAGRGEDLGESGSVMASLNGVSKSFVSEDGSVKDVLDSVSLEFGEGITGLLGPSGRGKTTVARLITGLERPDKGKVTVEPEVRPDVLFQEDRLLPWLTAYENMLLALVGRKGSASDVMRMAEKLELTDSLDRKPDELSGGMAHRVSLGRALLGKSRLLILDEPMRGLNQDLKERILRNIEDDLKGRTVILISHDEGLTESLTGNVIRM